MSHTAATVSVNKNKDPLILVEKFPWLDIFNKLEGYLLIIAIDSKM
jgi:hypothetical protein